MQLDGDIDNRVRLLIRSLGMTPVKWNKDSNDWKLHFVVNETYNWYPQDVEMAFKKWNQSGNRGIISLQHDLFKNSSAMVPRVLEILFNDTTRVAHFQTVSQCTGLSPYNNTSLESTFRYINGTRI
jgi:peptidoglycan/xylan/chitin deacetylase (PgdA/CDA1 family)